MGNLRSKGWTTFVCFLSIACSELGLYTSPLVEVVLDTNQRQLASGTYRAPVNRCLHSTQAIFQAVRSNAHISVSCRICLGSIP